MRSSTFPINGFAGHIGPDGFPEGCWERMAKKEGEMILENNSLRLKAAEKAVRGICMLHRENNDRGNLLLENGEPP